MIDGDKSKELDPFKDPTGNTQFFVTSKLAATPDGRRLGFWALGWEKVQVPKYVLFDLAGDIPNFRPLARSDYGPTALSAVGFLPSGSAVLAGDDDGRLHRFEVGGDRMDPKPPATNEKPWGLWVLPASGQVLLSLRQWRTLGWRSQAGAAGGELPKVFQATGRYRFTQDGLQFLCLGEQGVWSGTVEADSLVMLSELGEKDRWLHAGDFAPGGEWAVTGWHDGTVRLHPVARGRLKDPLTLTPHPGGVTGVTFSPDGRRLATAGKDRKLRLYHLDAAGAKPAETLDIPAQETWVPVQFSPDGNAVCIPDWDGSLRLMDMSGTEKPDVRISGGRGSHWPSFSFAPNGKTVAYLPDTERVVVWDLAARKAVWEWACSVGQIKQVAFAPDGRHLLTLNGNGTVYVLRLPAGVVQAAAPPEPK